MSTQPAPAPSPADVPASPPDVAAIVVALRRIIVDQLDVRVPEAQLTDDVALLERGLGFDSIVLFELITLIEKNFGFEFADQALHPEVFANLTALAQHIHGVLQSRQRTTA